MYQTANYHNKNYISFSVHGTFTNIVTNIISINFKEIVMQAACIYHQLQGMGVRSLERAKTPARLLGIDITSQVDFFNQANILYNLNKIKILKINS